MYNFDSDNCSSALPEILDAVIAANSGYQASYGRDTYTEHLQEVLQSQFGDAAVGYPVFNGTGANIIALKSMVPPWGAVICTSIAHINTDECGAPERVAGIKLLPVDTANGKLTAGLIDTMAHGFGDEHRAQPSVVAITQSTELGTVYDVHEVETICSHAHALGMSVYMDGARLANAGASLGVSLKSLTTDLGVDVVSFGGTKCGLLYGEVIVVINQEASAGINYMRMFNMQLASKMRYISAQLIALLEGGLWREAAGRANSMAALLRARLDAVTSITVTQPTQANAVFAILPEGVESEIRKQAIFQTWNPLTSEIRLMCSHDTTEEEVMGFADVLDRTVSNLRR